MLKDVTERNIARCKVVRQPQSTVSSKDKHIIQQNIPQPRKENRKSAPIIVKVINYLNSNYSHAYTPWNFDLACLSFIIHSVSFILDPFIC